MLANVTYDRTDRAYTVYHPETGEAVNSFPAGPDGRRAAFQTAILVANPDLYGMAAAVAATHPPLASRAWRAAEIVIADGVTRFDDATFIVRSQSSEYGDYTVTARNGELVCDCEDYVSLGAPLVGVQPMCKHILAAVFGRRLNRPAALE